MDEVLTPIPNVAQEEVVPPKNPVSIRKFLDNLSWIALFILTPAFFIAFLSQNSFPGDFLYPVKRGIEGTIIAAASVNPTTRAFFHSDLADRRFSEAEKLLLSQADTAPLNDLVSQVQSTETAIATADPARQAELTTKVIAQIDSYQAKLTSTAAQIQSSPSPFAQVPTQTQNQNQTQTENSVAIPSVPTAVPTVQVVTSVTTLTPIPAAVNSGQNPRPSQMQNGPTAAVTAAPSQVVTAPPPSINPSQIGTPAVEEQKKQVEQAVAVTKIKLEQVKKDLEEKSKQREQRNNENNSSKENKTTH